MDTHVVQRLPVALQGREMDASILRVPPPVHRVGDHRPDPEHRNARRGVLPTMAVTSPGRSTSRPESGWGTVQSVRIQRVGQVGEGVVARDSVLHAGTVPPARKENGNAIVSTSR